MVATKQLPKAIMDGIIVKRDRPTHYGNGVIHMAPRLARRPEYNQWVDVVSVGPRVLEDIKPGDRVLIGQQMGTEFTLDGEDYVFLFARDPILRERDGE